MRGKARGLNLGVSLDQLASRSHAAHLDVVGDLARARMRQLGMAHDVGPRHLEVDDRVGRVAGAHRAPQLLVEGLGPRGEQGARGRGDGAA